MAQASINTPAPTETIHPTGKIALMEPHSMASTPAYEDTLGLLT